MTAGKDGSTHERHCYVCGIKESRWPEVDCAWGRGPHRARSNPDAQKADSPYICADCPGGRDQTQRAEEAEAERDAAIERAVEWATKESTARAELHKVKAERDRAMALYEAQRGWLQRAEKAETDRDRYRAAARDVVEGFFLLRGYNGHHMGCECGGVAYHDALRAEAGDFTNLHTCNRFLRDMETLRELLER